MRKGGFRKKMNLDLSPEDFSKLSLREANEIIDRLAKRYNQRVKEFYKFDQYASLKIYEYLILICLLHSQIRHHLTV